ncbi:MAG TPA: 16S rRNA (cytosine(967)-C(5))-methyltransferase RsmB [Burkholderiales bacterium]|nr:16S rRNA (cytosine(967)-C(5))-methyltransferase RsmB [Burkholderiales bacterium]
MKLGAELAPALAEAARVVSAVAAGSSLDEVLERGPGREAVMDLCFSTLRHYGRVQALEQMLSVRGRAAPRIRALLWCALSAAEREQYAPHTLVDQAVRACGILEQPHARGYVNGVLRRYLRERDAAERRLGTSEEASLQHPAWWIERLRRDHPVQWRSILDAGNSHPPLCLRVNRRRIQVEAYRRRLEGAGISGRQIGECAILLDRPIPVARLPGFAEGEVSVQDAGAQRCAAVLDLADGQRVLDACAAPGGKAAHILESAEVRLVALDASGPRAARIESALTRLGLLAEVRVADCTALPSWWDGRPFDRVLADVPCTGSGVVRRHPDMKWLRRPDDVREFAARQQAILEALWRVVAPGGKLLYVTCSVFREENDAVLETFGGRHPDAVRENLPGGAMPQLLPCAEHDGFFFGLLTKAA